jgi:hypothetical protein
MFWRERYMRACTVPFSPIHISPWNQRHSDIGRCLLRYECCTATQKSTSPNAVSNDAFQAPVPVERKFDAYIHSVGSTQPAHALVNKRFAAAQTALFFYSLRR